MATPSINEMRMACEDCIRTLINNDLKEVCKGEKLTLSGRKSEVQDRIRGRLNAYLSDPDPRKLQVLYWRLRNPRQAANQPPNLVQISPPSYSTNTGYAPSYGGARQPLFKSSPFYNQKKLLSQFTLPVCQNHRNTGFTNLTFTAAEAAEFGVDSSLRVFIYSAVKADPYQSMDIAFPSQVEIKVNDHEVKANTRGMKNKPGTTKPVDITPLLRKRPDHTNRIVVTYALTDKVYQISIFMTQKMSIEQLMAQVQKKLISKERTLKDLRAKAEDPDLVTTSTVMKLKDPVSFQRIGIPCRGSLCVHSSCFDLYSYLAMQEQAPQWECPICFKKATFDNLAVDQYVQEILQSTSSSVEQVTIEPDGRWSQNAPASNGINRTGFGAYQDEEDSDDLIEISAPRPSMHVKPERANTPQSLTHTPPMFGENVGSRGTKRPAPEVIVISDSEDDEQPVPKRHQGAPQSYSTQVYPSTTAYPNSYSPVSFTLPRPSDLHEGTGSSSPFQGPPSAISFNNALQNNSISHGGHMNHFLSFQEQPYHSGSSSNPISPKTLPAAMQPNMHGQGQQQNRTQQQSPSMQNGFSPLSDAFFNSSSRYS